MYPALRLFTAGITKSRETWYEPLRIPNADYPEFVNWFRQVAREMDFAVAPLTATDFNRAKSSLKLLEYTAAGLPVIASDVSPYREEIEDGVSGLLATNNTRAWANALRFACEQSDKMQAMAVKQRENVLRHHLMAQRIPKFDSAISCAIASFRDANWPARKDFADPKLTAEALQQ